MSHVRDKYGDFKITVSSHPFIFLILIMLLSQAPCQILSDAVLTARHSVSGVESR